MLSHKGSSNIPYEFTNPNNIGHECSDLRVGGSAVIRTLFGFVNPSKILDNP